MIPFSLYMQKWLYGENGYYQNMPQIGKDGDFYTSVSASIFFGGSIAKYIIKVIDEGFLPKNTHIIEFGAHRGYFLSDIIQFIFTLKPQLLQTLNFVIIEPIKKIQNEQKKYFHKAFENKINIQIYNDIKEFTCKDAFVLSNELFDSFACEVVKDKQMLFVQNDKLLFKNLPKNIQNFCDKYNINKGEINIHLDEFVQNLNACVKKYEFISFDYGDMQPRDDISLRVYKNHQVYPFFELTKFASKKDTFVDFFQNSDITYDVCFLHVKDVFEQNGAKMHKFCTQMVALHDFGITSLLQMLQENVDENTYLQQVQKVKRLLLPDFLGERFKMISIRKSDETNN